MTHGEPNDGTVDLVARVVHLEAERTRYFRWAYAAVVALAKDELEAANAAAEPGQWPAQQSWEGLGGTSRSVFMRRARERAGIDHDEFPVPVRDGSIDVEDLHGPMPDPARGDSLAKLEARLADIHMVLLAAARDVRPSATRDDTPTPLLARQVASLAVSTKLALEEARLCLLAEAGDPRGAEGLHPGWVCRAVGWCLVAEKYRPPVAALRRERTLMGEGPITLGWTRNLILRRWTEYVPVGMTIREAMRWVESQVLPS